VSGPVRLSVVATDGTLGTMSSMKKSRQVQHLDGKARAQAKQASRDADARALASGRRSAAALRQENEVVANAARSARLDLAASRSLS
jgi:hypothetical protein